ncbi:MAG: DUF5671 domain-containing protein [Terrabacter sp.]
MLVPLALALIVLVVAVLGGRRALSHDAPRISEGSSIRRFFTYVVLFGLLMVAGSGVAGLLSRAIDVGRETDFLDDLLAQQTAFAVVGVPLFVVLAAWTRSRVRGDEIEARSRGLAVYLTAASVVPLVMTVTALQSTAQWALGVPYDNASHFGEVLVWGGAWAGHQWVERRLVGGDVLTRGGFLGATIGLLASGAGAVMALGGLLGQALQIPEGQGPGEPSVLQAGAATLIAGIPVWLACWVVRARSLERSTLWHGYVLLVGVAGGLLTAVVGASVALDRLVVWLARGAEATAAPTQLSGLPVGVAAVVVGGLVWVYHRAVLRVSGQTGRTEVRRAYDYLLAGVGLVAASVGLVVMVVAGIEGLASTDAPLVGGTSPLDTVIAAATLLAVGGPVWWMFWHRVQRAVVADPVAERRSGSRRAYVLLLFGVAAVVAVGALLAGVASALQDGFAGNLGTQTLQAVRYPVALIVAAGLLAAYHWTVYRDDRAVRAERRHGPRHVVLVGPADPDVVRAVRQHTGSTATLMARTDVAAAPWSVEALDAVLNDLPDAAVVVLADERGDLHTFPVSLP